jgi:hypothetical protein
MPARHTDSASVWGFAIYPASQRVQEHGPLCGLGRVPWSGGNEGVVVNLSDGARAGR